MLVATRSFVDPSDGQWIEAGLTYVAEVADVARSHPQHFKPATGRRSGPITRVGGTIELGKPRPRRRVAPKRPAERDVELREHFVNYRVSLSPYVRRDIEREISRVHREAGEIEVAGWLFAQYAPRADLSSTAIAFATRSTERAGTRGEVYLSDPAAAEALCMPSASGTYGSWATGTCIPCAARSCPPCRTRERGAG